MQDLRTWTGGLRAAALALATACVCRDSTGATAAELTGRYRPAIQLHETDSGIRFGIWGTNPSVPAPTLLVLALDIEQNLGNPEYRQAANQLAAQGYLVVSIDLPCHGRDRHPGEPEGLAGWRHRLDRGEKVIEPFVERAGKVLDHLVKIKLADPKRIAVCGTSRGGFAAMHLAALDKRVRCAAAFAPVSDLAVLTEFKDSPAAEAIDSLALVHSANALATKDLWMAIGDADQRVGTDKAVELARRVAAAAHYRRLPGRVDLHVLGSIGEHLTPAGSARAAAAWIARELDTVPPEPLFDGKTLAGWEGNLDTFRVKDGAIVGGSLAAPVPRNEFLCTYETFGDFELRLKFKVLGQGVNAGVQFRTRRMPNHWEVIGYQADLGEKYWGALYDESRRAKILASPPAYKVAKVLRPGDWNDYTIRCQGDHIQLWLNELKTVDYVETDPGIDRSGVIALQIHGGQPSEAWYKDIRIRRLD